MQKSLTITGVKNIANIAQPIIVLEVQGHPAIVRNPKQMLTDLTNSFRCVGVTSTQDPRFAQELGKLFGATLTGDLRAYKAGDKYVVTEGHPALTDRNHKDYGKVKLGEQLVAEKDGVWVEGFLSIPKTFAEQQLEANATAYASVMAAFMGITAPTATFVPETTTADSFVPEGVDNTPEQELVDAALGTKKGK